MLVELKTCDGPMWVNPQMVIFVEPCERRSRSAVPDICVVQMFGEEGRLMAEGTASKVAAKLNAAEAANG